MLGSRRFEIAGFVVIAASLHVSAAAVMLPEQIMRGAPEAAPPAALAAGSVDLAAMVSEWDAPPSPETETTDMAEPEPPVEEVTPPAVDEMPVVAAMAPPPALAAPETAVAQPNLPEPPEPQPEIVPPELPELKSFSPPEIEVEPALTLEASARPLQRPEKPEPKREVRQREPEKPRQQAKQQPQQKAGKQAQKGQGATSSRAGQGGTAAGPSGGGGGGVSSAQRASMQAKWQSQISACLLRSIARTSGGKGLRATLAVQVGRNGRVQAAQVTGSSGNARVDSEIARGAKRARCPAAPKALTQSSYSFTQPIRIR